MAVIPIRNRLLQSKYIRMVMKMFFILSIFLLLLLLTVSLVLYSKRDRIYQMVIEELNAKVVGYVTIDKVSISPFRQFPYISIDLKHAVLYEEERHLDSLVYFQDIYAGFNVYDLIKGDVIVKKLALESGFVKMEKDTQDQFTLVNALAPVEHDTDSVEEVFLIDMKGIYISNTHLLERNVPGQKYLDVYCDRVKSTFFSHDDTIRLTLRGDLILHHYISHDVVYFKDKKMSMEVGMDVDLERGMVVMHPGKLQLPYGHLQFKGSIDFKNDIDMDLQLEGEKQSFDALISLLPEDIMEDLHQFKADGDMFFKGVIQGKALHQSPHIQFEFGCVQTELTKRGNSSKISDIRFEALYSSGEDNTLESSFIQLKNFYAKPGSGVLRGSFLLTNFLRPIVQMDFHARIDLQEVGEFYRVEGLRKGSGLLTADITLDEFVGPDSAIHMATRLSDGSSSRVVLKDVMIDHEAMQHVVQQLNGVVKLVGDDVQMDGVSLLFGKSDIKLRMAFKNISAFIHGQSAPVDISIHGESNALYFDDILTEQQKKDKHVLSDEVIRNAEMDIDVVSSSLDLKRYKMFPTAHIYCRKLKGELKHYPYPISQFYAHMYTCDTLLDIQKVAFRIADNDLEFRLKMTNPYALVDTNSQSRITFETGLYSNKLDIKQIANYRGHSLLDSGIDSLLEQELFKEVSLRGSGHFYPNSLVQQGMFIGDFQIDEFRGGINQWPQLKDTRGRLVFTRDGHVKLKDFHTLIGKSDFSGELFFKHLQTDQETFIEGSLKGQRWDIDDLTQYTGPPVAATSADAKGGNSYHDSGFNLFTLPFPVAKMKVEVGSLVYHKYHLEQIKGVASTDQKHNIFIDTFYFRAAGGEIGMKGRLNGEDKDNIFAVLDINLHHIDIHKMFYKLDNFGQDYLIQENVSGIVSARIKSRMKLHTDLTVDMSDMKCDMDVVIDNGSLKNFGPMEAMSDFLGNKNLHNIRFGRMENRLNFSNGKLNIPQMQLNTTIGYIKITGQQRMMDYMQYEIQVPLSLVRQAGWQMVKNKLGRSRTKTDEDHLSAAEQEIISSQTGLIKGYVTFTMTSEHGSDFDIKMGKMRKE
jgi:hypothetical protein